MEDKDFEPFKKNGKVVKGVYIRKNMNEEIYKNRIREANYLHKRALLKEYEQLKKEQEGDS